jgi:hypothetical protein
MLGQANDGHRTPDRAADPGRLGVIGQVAFADELIVGLTPPTLAEVVDLGVRRLEDAPHSGPFAASTPRSAARTAAPGAL